MQTGMWSLLHRAFHVISDTGNAQWQTGRRTMCAIDG